MDTGADVCCATDEMREDLGRAPLRDALGRVIGIGGSNFNLEKNKLRIVTSDKEITVVESRKVGHLGVNANNNSSGIKKRFVVESTNDRRGSSKSKLKCSSVQPRDTSLEDAFE